MDPMQVKFWFQNKRTQMKVKHDRQQNALLRFENEKLRAENISYREALSNSSCAACGHMAAIGNVPLDERHLRMENARLRQEIERISAAAATYVGKPFTNSVVITPSSSIPRSTSLGCGPFFRGSTSKTDRNMDEENSDEPENAP
ncbi:hypothetical protein DH2020_031462 [Rehmannia glutinosa]|uniref:Homeobox domain-containing protein n=1 Tax=Rehmannia glutinosa TaxID=99300 RepID=A0ABR0VHY3_REHGL